MEKQQCYVILFEEFNKRKQKNASYSIRAFARDLKVSNTALADFLSGKRHLSRKNLEKIIESLKFSPLQRETFLEENKAKRNQEDRERQRLEEDQFRSISDWQSYAILSLARIKNAKSDEEWIAARLGINRNEAKQAVERLERLGLISTDKGRLVRKQTKLLTTTQDVPSSAIRKFHRDNLQFAINALETVPVELRDISSIVFPADPTRLKVARDIMVKAMRRAADMMDNDENQEVYSVSFQIYPMTTAKGGNS